MGRTRKKQSKGIRSISWNVIENDINLYHSFNKQKGENYMYSKITKDRMNLEGIVGHADDFYNAYKQAQQKIKEKKADDFDYRLIKCMPIIHRLINNHQDMFVSEQKQCIKYIHNILFDKEIHYAVVKNRECYICPDGHVHAFSYTDKEHACLECGKEMIYVGTIDNEGYCNFKLEIIGAKELCSKDNICIVIYKYKVIYDDIVRKYEDMLSLV